MSLTRWTEPHPKPAKGSPLTSRRADAAKADRAGSKAVNVRSGGRCEVVTVTNSGGVFRCGRRATEVHHMISGRGKRGFGISTDAERKQHVCAPDHLDITGGVGGRKLLLMAGGNVPMWSDRYQRVEK